MVGLVNGVVAVALELERLHGIRYYTVPISAPRFRAELAPAVAIVNRYSPGKSSCYDEGAIVRLGTDDRCDVVRLMMLRQLVCAGKWSFVDHHLSHATYALIDSPFSGLSLVASFDSGGNDGEFNLYLGSNTNLSLLLDTGLRVGNAYTVVATFIPSVTGIENGTTAWTELHAISASFHHVFFEAATPTVNSCGHACLAFLLSLPGKLMAFAALGVVREELVDVIDGIFGQRHSRSDHPMRVGILPEPLASTRVEDLAASMQAWFSRKVVDTILFQLDSLQEQPDKELSGIVLTGGCALNVRANSDLMLQAGMPVYVPAAPGDSGLAVGAAYHAFFSGRPGRVVPIVRLSAYSGVHLWDLPDVPHLAVEYQASPLALPELAKLFAEGHVAAIVRGRTEFGPRSLGHRSLMAFPANADVKARLNRLKSRGWYRPVALTMPGTWVTQLFGSGLAPTADAMFSPFMSFAPSLLPSSAKRFPAIAHIDSTCRVQTVDRAREAESWLFDLLLAVGALTGAPLLANTSLNLKGQPILNRASDAVSLFRTQKEIDLLVLEDWIFRAREKNSSNMLLGAKHAPADGTL
jgi:carbamoyltransferase